MFLGKRVAFLGIDIGTTGARCCAFDEDGQALSIAKRNYRVIQPKPGWVEQDPEEILKAVYDSVAQAIASLRDEYEVEVVGLSSIFHSIMLVDSDMRKLTNLIIWGDNRSDDVIKRYREVFSHLYDLTGCPLHVNYPLAKLLWFKQECPELLERASRIVMIKEFVLWNLAHVNAIDISVASGSGLLNIHTKRWEETILEELGIDRAKISEPVSPLTVVGYVNREASELTGLREGTPIVIGAGDGALSSLGSDSIDEGKMVAMLGTSGAVRMIVGRPLTDKRRRTWCYVLDDDRWVVGCAINNAGIVMAWYIDGFYPDLKSIGNPYEEMERWARDVEPGAQGLLFLPFITGERCPYWNANARGVLFGLALHHDRRHVARAIIEGVCFRMRSIYEAVSDVVAPPIEIRGSGGLIRFDLWASVLSNVLGRSILRLNVEEASSLGAAIMAMKAIGAVRSYDEILKRAVRVVDSIEPKGDLVSLYEGLYELYYDVYWKLQEEFEGISRFQLGGCFNEI